MAQAKTWLFCDDKWFNMRYIKYIDSKQKIILVANTEQSSNSNALWGDRDDVFKCTTKWIVSDWPA
jgi:hypothetical protein